MSEVLSDHGSEAPFYHASEAPLEWQLLLYSVCAVLLYFSRTDDVPCLYLQQQTSPVSHVRYHAAVLCMY